MSIRKAMKMLVSRVFSWSSHAMSRLCKASKVVGTANPNNKLAQLDMRTLVSCAACGCHACASAVFAAIAQTYPRCLCGYVCLCGIFQMLVYHGESALKCASLLCSLVLVLCSRRVFP